MRAARMAVCATCARLFTPITRRVAHPRRSCVHMVNRAGRTGSRRINFVISHYFVDADKDFVVDNFCLKLEGAHGAMQPGRSVPRGTSACSPALCTQPGHAHGR